MKIINLYICLMMLVTTLGYAQFNEYEGDPGGGYGTPVQLHEVVITTQSNSYTASYSSYIPTYVAAYYSNSVPNGFDTTANAYSYGDYGGGPSSSQGTTYTVQPTTPTTPTTPPTQNLIDKPVLTLEELLALIKDLKTGTWNIVKTTLYAYVDSAGVTHIGYITSITDSSNTSHSLYYFNELGGNDDQVKLPEKNGVELHSSINGGNNFYSTPIVVVTTWDGTSTQPGISNPDSVWAIDNNTGNWLIVTSQQAYTDYSNKQMYALMVNNLKNYLGLNQEQVSWLSADNDRIIQLNEFYQTPYNTPQDSKQFLEEYMSAEIITDTNLQTNPFVEGKNYVFDEFGKPKTAGATGNLIQIEINGVLKSPSQLDVNNLEHRKILSKIGVFFAVQLHAPIGTQLSSGIFPTDPKAIAYTEGRYPYIIKFNYKSGSFDPLLNNIYNFKSTVKHELLHRADRTASPSVPSNLSTHIDVYLAQMTDVSFNNTTDNGANDFKLSIVRSLAVYILNMDKKRNADNSYVYQKSKVKEKMDAFNDLNLHYKFVYEIDFAQGGLTIKIKDTNNPLNTPEDAGDSYHPINEN